MHIEIYSIKGFTGNVLKDRLAHALIDSKIDCEIDEINSVDEFVRAGIHSVPAIRVEERIFLHPQNGRIDETVGQVMDFIIRGSAPSILVPIDFSPDSLHAVEYATMMAEALGFGLTLTHIHSPVYDPVSGGACDVLLQKENTLQLHELAKQVRQDFKSRSVELQVDVHLESGDPSTNLIQLSMSEHFKLIIMATKGKDTAFRRVFSSITARVGRHSHKPVLIVPPVSDMSYPKNWLVGFDQAFVDKGSFDLLLEFLKEKVQTIQFVHVNSSKSMMKEEELVKFCNRITSSTNQEIKLKCESVDALGLPVDEVMLQQAKEKEADLIILFSQQRSFMESLQHSSVIRRVIQQPHLPVLIFPL
jgi:nucleotide-binding universal stress UspA family protein